MSALNAQDVLALAAVVNSCGKRVRRAMAEGEVVSGTARYLTGQGDSPMPHDVRDAYLRVTLDSGLEAWWPVATLAHEFRYREFVVDGAR